MAKVQYNVGTFKGYLGTAVLYLAKTASGTEFLTYLALENQTEYWTYMSRTAAQGYMLSNDVILSSNIDVSKLPDAAPDGVLDANGHVIIDNGNGLPRLSTGQGYYTLKGEGIADYSDDVGTPTSGTKTNSTVVVASGAKTLSESLTEAGEWAKKNWVILVIIGVVLLEVFGITHILDSLSGKKKTLKKRRSR
ncbi:hypothetical protein [Dyadobacter sp. 676]|uniref:Lamin tail domain-containing protein n=1 Tax=Dyadobacter sp. 676 TaxID=3088362 RepID=A0AAU8FMW3_9BACT